MLSLEAGGEANRTPPDVTEVPEELIVNADEDDDILDEAPLISDRKGKRKATFEDEFIHALETRNPGLLQSVPKSLIRAMTKVDSHERIENVSRKVASINKKKRVRI